MFALAVVAMLGLTMVGCSKDYADKVTGSYEGTMKMSVQSTDYPSVDATVVIKSEDENLVSITIPAMGEGRMAMPELTIGGVSVSKDGKTYNLSKEEINITVEEIAWTGTLSGSVESEKLTLTTSLKPGAMPMSIDLTFTTK